MALTGDIPESAEPVHGDENGYIQHLYSEGVETTVAGKPRVKITLGTQHRLSFGFREMNDGYESTRGRSDRTTNTRRNLGRGD